MITVLQSINVPVSDVYVEARLSLCYVRRNHRGNVGWVFGSSGLNRNIDQVTIYHKAGISYSSYRCWRFANRDVIRCSWEPESSRARQGTNAPERFFTKTLAVAKSTISLLSSCAIRTVEGSAEGEAEGSASWSCAPSCEEKEAKFTRLIRVWCLDPHAWQLLELHCLTWCPTLRQFMQGPSRFASWSLFAGDRVLKFWQ